MMPLQGQNGPPPGALQGEFDPRRAPVGDPRTTQALEDINQRGQEYIQDWRNQLADRQEAANNPQPFNPYASEPRIVGPANNGALGPGQYRAHPMLPGGVGLTEIPTPWRGVESGNVREDDMLRSRFQRLYEPYEGLTEAQQNRMRELAAAEGLVSTARGPQLAAQEAQATSQRLANIREARAAALARRAAPLRAAGQGNGYTDEQLLTMDRGLLPRSERGELVREKAQRRTRERMDRIANRQAVMSPQDRMIAQDPRLAIAGIEGQTARDVAGIRGRYAVDAARAGQGNQNQTTAEDVFISGVVAGHPNPAALADDFNRMRNGGSTQGVQIPPGSNLSDVNVTVDDIVKANPGATPEQIGQIIEREVGRGTMGREAVRDYMKKNSTTWGGPLDLFGMGDWMFEQNFGTNPYGKGFMEGDSEYQDRIRRYEAARRALGFRDQQNAGR